MSQAAAHGGGPTIRLPRPEDSPAIARLWHEGWLDAHVGRVPDALFRHRDGPSFASRAAERLEDARLAEIDGTLAGFLRVKSDEVEQIFVDRAYRGGAAAPALMRAAERLLAERGIRSAFLVVNPMNERAIAFYEKTGWARAGLVDYAAETAEGSFTMSILRMEKSVSAHSEAG